MINVILRKDVEGGEVEARYGQADDPGAEELTGNAIFGAVSRISSATLTAIYTSREQMFLRNREISRSADHFDRGGFDWRTPRRER